MMGNYRFFALDVNGTLFELCKLGWEKYRTQPFHRILSFANLVEARRHAYNAPRLPTIPDCVDIYIADLLDPTQSTWPVSTAVNL